MRSSITQADKHGHCKSPTLNESTHTLITAWAISARSKNNFRLDNTTGTTGTLLEVRDVCSSHLPPLACALASWPARVLSGVICPSSLHAPQNSHVISGDPKITFVYTAGMKIPRENCGGPRMRLIKHFYISVYGHFST